jgi:predicted Zn-dependent peptidase
MEFVDFMIINVYFVSQVFARIDSLTTEDVKATANKIVNDEDLALAGVGSILGLPDYGKLRSQNVWARG